MSFLRINCIGIQSHRQIFTGSRLLSNLPFSVKRESFQNGPRKTREQVNAMRNCALLVYSSAVIVVAIGASYAAVPLYRVFCAATGFSGTLKVGTGRFEPSRLVPVENARRIKKNVNVLPGESSLAFYTAKNMSDKDIIGIATYNVTPDRIAPCFSEVECFCFEEQTLLAGEEVDMPLSFFIDKDMLDDPTCKNVDDVVLSYTFFRAQRNENGHLVPDAPEDVVQNSLGFSKYEHASHDKSSDIQGTSIADTNSSS